jgi:hypothetical protein
MCEFSDFQSGTVETMFLAAYCALSLGVAGQRFKALEWPYIQGSLLTKHAVTERGIPAELSQINYNTVNVHDVTLCSLADQWEESRRMPIASTDAKSDMSHITLLYLSIQLISHVIMSVNVW